MRVQKRNALFLFYICYSYSYLITLGTSKEDAEKAYIAKAKELIEKIGMA